MAPSSSSVVPPSTAGSLVSTSETRTPGFGTNNPVTPPIVASHNCNCCLRAVCYWLQRKRVSFFFFKDKKILFVLIIFCDYEILGQIWLGNGKCLSRFPAISPFKGRFSSFQRIERRKTDDRVLRLNCILWAIQE